MTGMEKWISLAYGYPDFARNLFDLPSSILCGLLQKQQEGPWAGWKEMPIKFSLGKNAIFKNFERDSLKKDNKVMLFRYVIPMKFCYRLSRAWRTLLMMSNVMQGERW